MTNLATLIFAEFAALSRDRFLIKQIGRFPYLIWEGLPHIHHIAVENWGQRYHILQLPKELEAWAEQVRKFASTYFLCERSMPLANRTAERLWKLCQIGPCPAGFDGDDSCRQLLNIARDSFQLFWQQPLDPGDDDPCGLRCLRTKTQPLLCVRYTGPRGKRGKLRPSDIVRCELQCRRRLLELWDGGFFDGGFRSLPMVELPPEAKAAVTQGDIPGPGQP